MAKELGDYKYLVVIGRPGIQFPKNHGYDTKDKASKAFKRAQGGSATYVELWNQSTGQRLDRWRIGDSIKRRRSASRTESGVWSRLMKSPDAKWFKNPKKSRDFELGDRVRLKRSPKQTGTVGRGFFEKHGWIQVDWDTGPPWQTSVPKGSLAKMRGKKRGIIGALFNPAPRRVKKGKWEAMLWAIRAGGPWQGRIWAGAFPTTTTATRKTRKEIVSWARTTLTKLSRVKNPQATTEWIKAKAVRVMKGKVQIRR